MCRNVRNRFALLCFAFVYICVYLCIDVSKWEKSFCCALLCFALLLCIYVCVYMCMDVSKWKKSLCFALVCFALLCFCAYIYMYICVYMHIDVYICVYMCIDVSKWQNIALICFALLCFSVYMFIYGYRCVEMTELALLCFAIAKCKLRKCLNFVGVQLYRRSYVILVG